MGRIRILILMRVSLIGMSNIGKSYWAKRLAAHHGYARLDCDVLIERRLEMELGRKDFHGLRSVANWMGYPSDPTYKEHSELYMHAERFAMQQSLQNLRDDDKTPFVIDATGSVIYSGADILAELRDATKVIYLEASESHVDEMFKRYLAHPKPTIWGEDYVPQIGETAHQTLKRCYPTLLHNRALRYQKIAHITIPFEKHKDPNADLAMLIKEYMN